MFWIFSQTLLLLSIVKLVKIDGRPISLPSSEKRGTNFIKTLNQLFAVISNIRAYKKATNFTKIFICPNN
ncbi:hypothetical protein J19TS1_11780 [Heyndrickxia oleronia]|nr:hypothetical protein J19TS1_11780 [Heyndrickxia oleronia]